MRLSSQCWNGSWEQRTDEEKVQWNLMVITSVVIAIRKVGTLNKPFPSLFKFFASSAINITVPKLLESNTSSHPCIIRDQIGYIFKIQIRDLLYWLLWKSTSRNHTLKIQISGTRIQFLSLKCLFLHHVKDLTLKRHFVKGLFEREDLPTYFTENCNRLQNAWALICVPSFGW